jgi:hypothetical protein
MPWVSYSRAGTEFNREAYAPSESCHLLCGDRQSELEGEPSGSRQRQPGEATDGHAPAKWLLGSLVFLLADDVGPGCRVGLPLMAERGDASRSGQCVGSRLDRESANRCGARPMSSLTNS